MERSIATYCAAIKAGRSAVKALSERLAAERITGLLSMQILVVAVVVAVVEGVEEEGHVMTLHTNAF